MKENKFLGIFVYPMYAQYEGIKQVFDNIEALGANAICTTPLVAYPADEGKGQRKPDLHIDGYKRLLSRPIWGKQEIQLEYFPAHDPDLSIFKNSFYKPISKKKPPEVDPEIVNAMIAEAKKRGMAVHLMIHPFLPPDIRVEDQPKYIDNSVPKPPQVALTACMNNPNAVAYGLALIEDTIKHYPKIDGLFIDWAEYGAYHLEDHFTCFCSHCEQKALELGFDWNIIKRDMNSLWQWFHSLTPKKLEHSLRVLGNPSSFTELFIHYPGCLQFLQFKAETVVGFYRQTRQLINTMGLNRIELSARGWAPPWNHSSGLDYRALSEICNAVTPKLFTFDYCALPRWYGQTIQDWNPKLTESIILDTLLKWMNLEDNIGNRSFAKYNIPGPKEKHPARFEVYQTRIDEVLDQVESKANCYPHVCAYMLDSQWEQMVSLIRNSKVDGMWVTMYGYLSNRKLEIIKKIWQ